MRDIPIFIASSIVEFKDERKELIEYLWTLNKLYKPRGVRLEWDNPEDMSHEVFPDGTQSEIDKAICESDFFFVIVGRDMGPYTLGEFETAWARRKAHGKPKVYAYFLPPAGQLPEQSALDFRNRLKDLKHYYKTCGSMAEVKLEMQIELFRNIDFGGAREASSKEETAQKGQDAARELVREQRDKIAQLKAQPVSPETIAKLTDAYEEIRRLVQTYKVEPNALDGYLVFLWQQHLYDTAIKLGGWLENFYKLENPGDRAWAILKHRIAVCYQESNQHGQAEQYYQEELKIWRDLGNKDWIAHTYNNLGNLLSDTNRMEEAERYYREALEIRRRLAKDNPAAYTPDVAHSCNNLAVFIIAADKMEQAVSAKQIKEAEPLLQKANEIWRRFAAQNPAAFEPDVAIVSYNLGVLKYKRNRPEAARPYFEESLSLFEKFPHCADKAQQCRDALAKL